jgi:CopG antitoxin of type II toxin-antitoxin system
MPESELGKLPQFGSSQELVDFFDTHDMGEYESQLPEVEFDIDLKREYYRCLKAVLSFFQV